MKGKRLLTVGLTALMGITAFAGCSSDKPASSAKPSDGPITLTVWTPQEDQAEDSGNWLNKELEAFKAAHPEWQLEFKVGTCGEGDAGSMVTQDPEAAADVFMFANDQIPTLLNAGSLAELGGSTLDDVNARNDKGIVDYVTYNGGVYGVPFTTNTWFMYYDKRVFSDDDVKNLDKMLEKGKVAFPLNNGWYIASFYLANGCTMFGDGTDGSKGIQFGGDAGLAVTNYLIDLAANKNFINDADGVGVGGLGDGSVNAIFSGSWDYQNVVNALGAENVGVAVPPTITIDGQEKQMLSFAGIKAIGVNAHSKNMQAAVALASFLGSTQAQQDHFDLRAIVPTDKTIKVEGNTMIDAQNATVDHASFPQPFVPEMGNYWTPAGDFGKNIVDGAVTHDNAKDMLDAFVELLNSAGV
ncbi:MAG: extracellular solute-binding protein [Solobacterium sp.]|nr:extracellular solute-binding protein [Solobacterium sp.]